MKHLYTIDVKKGLKDMFMNKCCAAYLLSRIPDSVSTYFNFKDCENFFKSCYPDLPNEEIWGMASGYEGNPMGRQIFSKFGPEMGSIMSFLQTSLGSAFLFYGLARFLGKSSDSEKKMYYKMGLLMGSVSSLSVSLTNYFFQQIDPIRDLICNLFNTFPAPFNNPQILSYSLAGTVAVLTWLYAGNHFQKKMYGQYSTALNWNEKDKLKRERDNYNIPKSVSKHLAEEMENFTKKNCDFVCSEND